MNKQELQLEFTKLVTQGYNINTRCMGYNMALQLYPEFLTWKKTMSLFIERHLVDHAFSQQVITLLNSDLSHQNSVNELLTLLSAISQDNEYWRGGIQSSVNGGSYYYNMGNQASVNPVFNQMWNGQQPIDINGNSPYQIKGMSSMNTKEKFFIVHGHDNEAKQEMARVLEKLGFDAIILHEQPDAGRTIIEKIEHFSDVVYAVVLYTECDVGRDKNDPSSKERYRARQNVVFEHGYLVAKLTRERVCAFVKGDVETPSDISGVIFTTMDAPGAWKQSLVKNMKAVGLEADINKLL